MAAAKKGSVRPDIATLAGLALALGGIIGGLVLEGGKLGQILQPTAAMIVFGGTFGAVMVTMPLPALTRSVRAGGYAPTVGIIGAVLGLIQVMQHIQNVEEVGKGIAVAFVATIYGVGAANLFLIPAAGKIRARAHAAIEIRELMLEGVCGIVEGLNPKLIRVKLEAFVESKPKPGAKAAPKGEPAKAA